MQLQQAFTRSLAVKFEPSIWCNAIAPVYLLLMLMLLILIISSSRNDFSEKEFFVDLAASLIFTYGVSAILFKVIVSVLFEIFGSGVLFIYIGIVHLLLCVFGAYRMTIRPTVDDKKPFLAFPRTSFVFFKMFKKSKSD